MGKNNVMEIKELLEKFLESQKELNKSIQAIEIILSKQQQSLEYHIKRTDLLQQQVEMLQEQFEPVKDSYKFNQKFFRVVVTSVAVLGSIAGIIKLFLLKS